MYRVITVVSYNGIWIRDLSADKQILFQLLHLNKFN